MGRVKKYMMYFSLFFYFYFYFSFQVYWRRLHIGGCRYVLFLPRYVLFTEDFTRLYGEFFLSHYHSLNTYLHMGQLG